MSGIFNGKTFDPTLNFTPSEYNTHAAVTVTVNYGTINNYTKEKVPILTPFGFISLPPNNANCAYIGVPGYQASAIAGYTNQLPGDSNMSDMVKGESGFYSTGNFTLKAKLDALKSVFTNDVDDIITTTLPISENVVTILVDVIDEIIAFVQSYNNLVNTFNSFNANFMAHVHGGVTTGGGDTTGTMTIFPNNPNHTTTANFNRDHTFINDSPSKMYININGVVLS